MKLARFWTRGQGEAIDPDGRRVRVVARGWSDQSMDAARARAGEIIQRVVEHFASTAAPAHEYQYGDRPLPEPIIKEFGPSAVVTRNAYGALVLNTDNLMFADVDCESPKPSQAVLDRVRAVAERHDFSARVYKTAGGYRVLIGNAGFQAGSPETETLLNEFGADPLYIRLCRIQESFRARLSPKPWRCRVRNLPVVFPFETSRAEGEYRNWEREYNSKAAAYSTCSYVTTFGGVRVAPEFEDLIYYHDQETKANSNFPLA